MQCARFRATIDDATSVALKQSTTIKTPFSAAELWFFLSHVWIDHVSGTCSNPINSRQKATVDHKDLPEQKLNHIPHNGATFSWLPSCNHLAIQYWNCPVGKSMNFPPCLGQLGVNKQHVPVHVTHFNYQWSCFSHVHIFCKWFSWRLYMSTYGLINMVLPIKNLFIINDPILFHYH